MNHTHLFILRVQCGVIPYLVFQIKRVLLNFKLNECCIISDSFFYFYVIGGMIQLSE